MQLRHSLAVLLTTVTVGFGADLEKDIATFFNRCDASLRKKERINETVDMLLSSTDYWKLPERLKLFDTPSLADLLIGLYAGLSKKLYNDSNKALIVDIIAHPEFYTDTQGEMVERDSSKAEDRAKVEERVKTFGHTFYPMIDIVLEEHESYWKEGKSIEGAWFAQYLPDMIQERRKEQALLRKYEETSVKFTSNEPLTPEEAEQAWAIKISQAKEPEEISQVQELIKDNLVWSDKIKILRDALSKREDLTDEQRTLLTLDLLKALGGEACN